MTCTFHYTVRGWGHTHELYAKKLQCKYGQSIHSIWSMFFFRIEWREIKKTDRFIFLCNLIASRCCKKTDSRRWVHVSFIFTICTWISCLSNHCCERFSSCPLPHPRRIISPTSKISHMKGGNVNVLMVDVGIQFWCTSRVVRLQLHVLLATAAANTRILSPYRINRRAFRSERCID